MKLRSRLFPAVAVAALVLSACADDVQDPAVEDTETEAITDTETTDGDDTATDDAATDDTGTGETATDDGAAGEDSAAGSVELGVASSDIGDHLVDGEGRTLYVSTNDEDGVSNCGNECAQIWKPVVVDGEPTVTGDLDASLVATAEREDGTSQVTYNGAPLYTFVTDAAEGDARGHGVNGTWWAVSPEGEPIQEGGAQAESGDATVSEDAESGEGN